MSRTLANDSIHVFKVKIAAVARGVARSYGRTVAATGTIPASRASAYILASSRWTDSASDPPKMSFTPARRMTYAGFAERTSRANRPRISAAVWPSIPRFKTIQSGWAFIIQCAYWLSGFPWPFGGASSGERNPGVPAVVESPRPTITHVRTDISAPRTAVDMLTGAVQRQRGEGPRHSAQSNLPSQKCEEAPWSTTLSTTGSIFYETQAFWSEPRISDPWRHSSRIRSGRSSGDCCASRSPCCPSRGPGWESASSPRLPVLASGSSTCRPPPRPERGYVRLAGHFLRPNPDRGLAYDDVRAERGRETRVADRGSLCHRRHACSVHPDRIPRPVRHHSGRRASRVHRDRN